MNGLEPVAKLLVGTGIALVIVGASVWLISRTGGWGQIPGDIRVERDGFTCLIPLASSLILSILLTILLNVIVRLINR